MLLEICQPLTHNAGLCEEELFLKSTPESDVLWSWLRRCSWLQNDRPLFEKTGYDFVVYTLIAVTQTRIFATERSRFHGPHTLSYVPGVGARSTDCGAAPAHQHMVLSGDQTRRWRGIGMAGCEQRLSALLIPFRIYAQNLCLHVTV